MHRAGAAVVFEPPVEPSSAIRICGHVLSSREALGMLLEALDAEKLAANQFFRGWREHRAAWTEESSE